MEVDAIRQRKNTFLDDDSGVTTIEYALLAGLIGVAIAASVGVLGDAVLALYLAVAAEVAGVMP